MKFYPHELACLLTLTALLAGCTQPEKPDPATAPASSAASEATRAYTVPSAYRIASWNLEWLDSKEGDAAVRNGCLKYKRENNGRSAGGKCDKPVRVKEDFDKLAQYAKTLNADVIGVQEVYSVEALKKVFPPTEFDYWLSRYKQQQKTGVVVRKSAFTIVEGRDFEELGIEKGRVRYGADVLLKDRSGKELRVLSVHLKSGCFDKVLTDRSGGSSAACPVLQQQLPILEKWVEERTKEARPFVVVGDFNRRLLWEARTGKGSSYQDGSNLWFWPELTDAAGKDVANANLKDAKPRKCGYGTYTEFIDHILVSPKLAAKAGAFEHLTYADDDFTNYALSDHCPIAVKLVLSN